MTISCQAFTKPPNSRRAKVASSGSIQEISFFDNKLSKFRVQNSVVNSSELNENRQLALKLAPIIVPNFHDWVILSIGVLPNPMFSPKIKV